MKITLKDPFNMTFFLLLKFAIYNIDNILIIAQKSWQFVCLQITLLMVVLANVTLVISSKIFHLFTVHPNKTRVKGFIYSVMLFS